jgi:predicted ATPase
MRIKRIHVENFKSLVDFDLELAKFTCLIGLNGSGKSTVLQFVDFLSQLVRGDMKGWLGERQWKSSDLRSRLTSKKNIEFCVRFEDERGKPAGRWEAHYIPSSHRCTLERMDLLDFVLETTKDKVRVLKVKERRPGDRKDWEAPITFSYQGSILSSLKEELLPASILNCKRFFQGVESLDMLTPERLRQRTRSADGSLGHGGRNLAAFVYELGTREQRDLLKRLKAVYPRLDDLHTKSLRSGWKQLEISEKYQGKESGFFPRMTTEARHINDGMLRLIALLAELQSEHRFVLFDEIENGINPELVEFVLNALIATKQQVMVTTHSPMILNYLDDDIAKKGVIYLYKTPEGRTRSIPFFSIPSLAEKLTVMGPGEAFVDTNLTDLADEIADMTREGA